ncbi:MAG: alkaline phosphatase family protein, partial [Candidatus Alcyoniella australis]|nr:alkaline phosphatase family protein [Candidatus Alcyoniella australis]
GVDMVLTGEDHPAYLDPPPLWSFYDPPTDPDRETDPESALQRLFCSKAYQAHPEMFPPDSWMVQSSLEMLRREKPDLAVLLLAEMDDSQHGLGTLVDPTEYEMRRKLLHGRVAVSRYNSAVIREPVLDAMRDVDLQFGKLMRGLEQIDYYRDALIVLYSDHGHITHRQTLRTNWDPKLNCNPLSVLYDKGLINRQELDGRGVSLLSGTSVGALYFKAETVAQRRRRAAECKQALEEHVIWDEFVDDWICPWIAVGERQGIDGIPGISEPGELFHPYFAENNSPGTLHHPDLALLMHNGWQLPIRKGLATNIGAKLPWYTPDDISLFIGGHGSYDTAGIVIAFQGPDVAQGKVLRDPEFARNYRISDIAMTVAARLGLELQTTTVGRDRSADLV